MPTECSASIAQWADETFGRAHDLRTIVRRARAEFEELEAALPQGALTHEALAHEALAHEDRSAVLAEAADVVILLHRLAHEMGGDLNAAVDAKMHINRARRWSLSGDGVGQHIKPTEE